LNAASVDRPSGTPLIVRALPTQAVASLVQVVDELSLVVLASNDSFLGAKEARRDKLVTRTGLLRRSVLVLCQSPQTVEYILARAFVIERLVLVVLRV